MNSEALRRIVKPRRACYVDEVWFTVVPGVLALAVSGLFIFRVIEPVLDGHSPRDLLYRLPGWWRVVRPVNLVAHRQWKLRCRKYLREQERERESARRLGMTKFEFRYCGRR